MNNPIKFPLTVPALRVSQPLGIFYVVSLPAGLVLQVADSQRLKAIYSPETNTYRLEGTQRQRQEKRLESITEYINRSDASFPNAIILAANSLNHEDSPDFDEALSDGQSDDSTDWSVTKTQNGQYELTIPSPAKTASIIDGQHRLFGFADADPDRLKMDLVCAVFIDLPVPFQAQLFATINSTQKPVDKSLTYEQFGYNISDEKPEHWTPDKLAVFLTRKLSTEPDSPLKGKILISPKKDAYLEELSSTGSWSVSTAVIVEGIMKLFSSNPKRDANNMLAGSRKTRAEIRDLRRDKSPLRELYLQGNDALIYKIVSNYLRACEVVFWRQAATGSFILKTVGIQALFDVLRPIAAIVYRDKDVTLEKFLAILDPAKAIDFSATEFRNASGSGRSFIARQLRQTTGLT
ncbi:MULTISPECIES: DGQHR domain-containing protein [Pseudomonas syringae group]|nr:MULTISPECIES: DGQHR domain-containing protein [Pseudomonas]MDO7929195.1 DGQHR domain-containing protein [Pseudomonas sp. KFB-138]